MASVPWAKGPDGPREPLGPYEPYGLGCYKGLMGLKCLMGLRGPEKPYTRLDGPQLAL